MSRENDTIWDGFRNNTWGGGGGGGGYEELKKGPWTPSEDTILENFVKVNGEGSWNDLYRKGILMRCGQSCRLRWVNHLRPNIKKGPLTPEEKRNIVRLHAEYGNKWSRLAMHLPGRTDNEIKNYWYTWFKRRVHDRLPVYPPEILQEIKRRDFFRPQPQKTTQSQIQFSSSSSPSFQDLDINSISSSLSSTFKANPSSSCNPSSSLSSRIEKPAFGNIDSTTLIEPMSYPLLIASPNQPNSLSEINLNGDKTVGLTFSVSPHENLHFQSSPYIPIFDESRQVTTLGIDLIPKMDDGLLSKNSEIRTPSFHSSFPTITTNYSSTSLNNNFILTSNHGECSNTALELYEERNNGLLEDVLRQPKASLSSHLPSKNDKQSKDDKSHGRIMHMNDNSVIMNNPSNNVNNNPVSVADNNYMKFVDASSSQFSSIDMGVQSQENIFEDLDMVNDDKWSWLDIPLTGPPKELNEFRDDPYTEPTNALASTNDVVPDNLHGEVLSSQVSLPNGNDMNESSSSFFPNDMGLLSHTKVFESANMTLDNNWHNWSWLDFPPARPLDDLTQHSNDATIPIEQEHDWALGYIPGFNNKI